jgi:hypothetical protein
MYTCVYICIHAYVYMCVCKYYPQLFTRAQMIYIIIIYYHYIILQYFLDALADLAAKTLCLIKCVIICTLFGNPT